MRLFKPNIDKLKAKRDVDKLIKYLNDRDEYVRWDVVKALREIGDPKAVGPLIKALGDIYEYARREAIEALGEIGDPKAVDPLIKALEDSDEVVRITVVKALGEIRDPKAVGPLIKALEDSDACYRASEALRAIGDPKAVELLIKILLDNEDCEIDIDDAARVIGEIGDEKAVEQLTKAFVAGNKDAGEALYSIGWKYPEKMVGAVPKLLKLLDSEDVEIRLNAAGVIDHVNKRPDLFMASRVFRTFWQIRELVDAQKTKKLIELYCSGVDIISGVIRLFTDRNYSIRSDAAYIFGKIGKRYPEEVKDGISKLASLLVDKKELVHKRAFEALIEIGMKRPDLVVGTIPAMVRYRGFPEIANDLNELVSSDFESAKVVTSNLVSLLYDDKDKVREIAAFALGVIGEERPELVKNAIPPLINLLKEGKNVNVRFVSFTLGAIGENRPEWVKNAIPKLVEILKNREIKNKELKIRIASAIGKIGRNEPEMVREAIPELIPLLRGKNRYAIEFRVDIELRVTAAEALIKIGKFSEERGKVISKIIDHLLSEEDAYAREKRSLFLGALKEYPETKEAIPLLVKLLDDPCWRVRGAAAFALGEIEEVVTDPKSLSSLADGTPLLTRLLGDDKAWVRLSAAYALSEIGGVEALEELKKLENDNERSKIWYLGEEREFEVKAIVNEAVEKIEARIEGREIRPELNVSLSKTKFKKEVQSAALFVENKGKVSARDIEIVFPYVLRVEGLRKFSLRAGESRKLELEVEPKEVGLISLTIAISFSDFKGNEYGSTEKFELEVEKAAITPERVVVGETGVIIERAIYDPCKRDFIEKPLPRMKQWINSHDPGTYWFVVSLQNSSDNTIEGWGVELETSSALKINEGKIEGLEIEIPHEAHLGLFKISVPKEYGIVIPKGGAQRVYFKMRAERPKTMYKIRGVFKSENTGDVPIRPKEFKYLCDAGMPPEAVKAELKKTFSEKEAARLALSFKTVQEIDRMCNHDAKTEEYSDKILTLKNYTEGFSEKFTMQVNDFSRFMEQEQMKYLDDEYKRKVRRFCTNLVDVWISEFLRG